MAAAANKKRTGPRGAVPRLAELGIQMQSNCGARGKRLRLLGSPPDLVHERPVAQAPHLYAEPRSRRCPTEMIILYSARDCKGMRSRGKRRYLPNSAAARRIFSTAGTPKGQRFSQAPQPMHSPAPWDRTA